MPYMPSRPEAGSGPTESGGCMHRHILIPRSITKTKSFYGGAIMTDSQLRKDIIEELEFDPSFSGEHIGVAVDRGVVTLGGHVNSYTEKLAAIAAARRVKGVHAIAENIEVHCSYEKRRRMIRLPSELMTF
jgi:BON domain